MYQIFINYGTYEGWKRYWGGMNGDGKYSTFEDAAKDYESALKESGNEVKIFKEIEISLVEKENA